MGLGLERKNGGSCLRLTVHRRCAGVLYSLGALIYAAKFPDMMPDLVRFEKGGTVCDMEIRGRWETDNKIQQFFSRVALPTTCVCLCVRAYVRAGPTKHIHTGNVCVCRQTDRQIGRYKEIGNQNEREGGGGGEVQG